MYTSSLYSTHRVPGYIHMLLREMRIPMCVCALYIPFFHLSTTLREASILKI